MISELKKILSKLNRARKDKFKSSYVSRRKLNEVAEKYESLIDGIVSVDNPLNRQPVVRCLQPIKIQNDIKDYCLFVSYAAQPVIKKHVAHHIKALAARGVAVILVINTDANINKVEHFDMPELSGLYLRENKGFDFGAWSQMFDLIKDKVLLERLYLVNDSLIGPLAENMLDALIQKVRTSKADFIGLTANTEPIFHLQSFFLVLGTKLLKDNRFNIFFSNLWNLPTKDMVIDFYEKRLTGLVVSLGFNAEVLFDTSHLKNSKSDAVIHSPEDLIKLDFPYVKVSTSEKTEGQKILRQFNFPY